MANETKRLYQTANGNVTAISSTIAASAFMTAAQATQSAYNNSSNQWPFAVLRCAMNWSSAPAAGGVIAFHLYQGNIIGTNDSPVPGVSSYRNLVTVSPVIPNATGTHYFETRPFAIPDSDDLLVYPENLTDQAIQTTGFDVDLVPFTFGT